MLAGGAGEQTVVPDAMEASGQSVQQEAADEPMWAHYADQFKGMCVQYNTKKLLRQLPPEVDPARMQYSEKPPTLLEDSQSAASRAKMALSSKTVRWSGEREWRIFRPEVGTAEYSDISCVTKIYLGSRISEADERAVRTMARVHKIAVVKIVINAYAISFSSTGKPS